MFLGIRQMRPAVVVVSAVHEVQAAFVAGRFVVRFGAERKCRMPFDHGGRVNASR